MNSKKPKNTSKRGDSSVDADFSSVDFQRALKSEVERVANGGTVVDKCSIKSLADFRDKYDKSFIVPKRIKAALKNLGKGWLYEIDFAREAGVAIRDLYAYRDQYAANIVHIPKENRRVWAGTPELARQMREMLA